MSRLSPTALALLALGAPVAAPAQAPPYVDGPVPLVSPDNDPDLFIARERFDPETRVQSLYVRAFDGTDDYEVFNGRLRVTGAEVVQVLFGRVEMAASDAVWGVPGRDYGGNAPERGLDGPDPLGHVPVIGDRRDAVRFEGTDTVRFWLGTRSDIDDFRILIRYPREPVPASFDVLLHHAGDPDPSRAPLTTQAGVHVGSPVDTVPDDGDYTEVWTVRRVKLRVEDVDLVEETVFLGALPPEGGVAGPGTITVDNFAGGVDADQDNGFDQNGLITPIPACCDLDHLVWRPEPLVNGRGDVIPADRVRLIGAPRNLALGRRVEFQVEVDVPEEAEGGFYQARLLVFEDNDQNGLPGRNEPLDGLRLQVAVGISPSDDGGFPDPPLPLDGGLDAGPSDAGPADGDLPDVDPADAALADGSAAGDAQADAGPPAEAGPDGTVTDIGGDVGVQDAGDGEPPGAEVGPARDAVPGDGGPPDADAGDRADAGPAAQDLGDARGGALGCGLAAGGGGAPPWPLLFGLAALVRRRRR